MGLLYHQEYSFKERIKKNLVNDFARTATLKATDGFVKRKRLASEQVPEWEGLREEASGIRGHVLDNLDYYLNEFAANAEIAGSQVHFALTAEEASDQVLTILKDCQGQRVVKSKSMVSEEIDLNHVLRQAGLQVTETDLGEWILQLADWDSPSHIIGPALHKDIHTIYDLFYAQGYRGEKDAYQMTKFARGTLRKAFLEADVGITGCNFAIADTGAVCLFTNEGNGRMVTTLPKTQIILMGMERILPSLEDLNVMMEVFVRSAVGTQCSSYLTMCHGPRQGKEQDGPEQVHIIIIDNGRKSILKSAYHDMLKCIRCGACQNICPVYRQVTGHAYGSIYEGPMGIVLTPLLAGYEAAGDLPFASTLCGACSDHCPVKIPLHELILQHRKDYIAQGYGKKLEEKTMTLAGQVLSHKGLYRFGTKLGAGVMGIGARYYGREGSIGELPFSLPVLDAWLKNKNLPVLKKQLFCDEIQKKGEGGYGK